MKIFQPRRQEKTCLLQHQGRSVYLTASQIAAMTGVAIRTARSYRADPDRMPPYIRELLLVKALGVIPGLDDVFVQDGEIRLINGYRYKLSALYSIVYTLQEVTALRRRVFDQDAEIRNLTYYLERWRQRAGAPTAANESQYHS